MSSRAFSARSTGRSSPVAVKARWPGSEIRVPTEDPFRQRVEQVGMPIELTERTAELNGELAELIEVESRLYNLGVRCEIKERGDTTCHACPLSAHDDPSSALHQLCSTGRAQERVLTEIAVANLR